MHSFWSSAETLMGPVFSILREEIMPIVNGRLQDCNRGPDDELRSRWQQLRTVLDKDLPSGDEQKEIAEMDWQTPLDSYHKTAVTQKQRQRGALSV